MKYLFIIYFDNGSDRISLLSHEKFFREEDAKHYRDELNKIHRKPSTDSVYENAEYRIIKIQYEEVE